MLSVNGIKSFLPPDAQIEIEFFLQTDSTNRVAMERALARAPHGTVVLAESQTHGRGRRGKRFFSPPGGGLYISFVLYFENLRFTNPTAITAYAAVRVCEAIESLCGIQAGVKWVNDIFYKGKKVGGILAEGVPDSQTRGMDGQARSLDAKSHAVGAVVLGIGLNISADPGDFPEELRGKAGSLFAKGCQPFTRSALAAELIKRVALSHAPGEAEIFEKYKAKLFMLGSTVTVSTEKENYTAKALDIDSTGRLIVEKENGETEFLSYGEINILV
ncbi:MAG: biotin--[acetyl-CoA-carboxylase] ligase [Clostridiales bacterium]|nr:biotin--[acetyl-CoA-carboxylase] ligase [Clostridiales bacterium]